MTLFDTVAPAMSVPHPSEPRQTRSDGRAAARRRWTINGDFVTLNPTGVARYGREVTMALDRLVAEGHPLTRDLELDIVVPGPGRAPLMPEAIPVKTVPDFRRLRLPLVWVQMRLPLHVPGGLVSFCNLAPVALRRHIACVHDMHTRMVPESYGRFFALAHRVILPALGRRAAAITTVSEFSRDRIVEYGVAREAKITVTYNGCDHALRWKPERSQLAAPNRPYVLCLGRGEAHKNLDLMLRLAPLLDARGIDVWMAGDVDEEMIRAKGFGWPSNLILFGRIDDDDFAAALAGARAFLFPSRIEGFGLPAAEAMALGCPVVASTAPCLPEICGPAALYADPDDVEGWARAVETLNSNAARREEIIAAGIVRARRYGWRRIAEQYLELMARIDEGVTAASPRDGAGRDA